ncbi:hypothetical protein [Pseudomonas monsensis]
MKILTYKRTHTGDPDSLGRFGINDCMGCFRDWRFDAIIGVGGIGSEPASHGIAGRVTWVGRTPSWNSDTNRRGPIVTFESFKLLDRNGPMLSTLAPFLASRMYERRARFLFKDYSEDEQAEAEALVETILSNDSLVLITNLSSQDYKMSEVQKPFLEVEKSRRCRPCSKY